MGKFAKTFNPENSERVEGIKVKFIVEDIKGKICVTDIMLQGGSVATTWVGHPSEIKWSFDIG